MTFLLKLIYHVIVLWTASYAAASLLLLWLFWKHRRQRPASAPGGVPAPTVWPRVTVQLPVYNETAVVRRLIAAACRLDYPDDHLEIQLLDDSTDGSTALVRAWLAGHPDYARKVRVLHREERSGYKAGALAAGLREATGEFVAIFDADFVPPPDFLRRTLPHLLARPVLGMVQTRWGYLNREDGLLTRAQALALDGHFVIEQFARNRAGLFINFNGSAGVWRKACLEAVGGWQADTLCEDLDVSYRAQLAGWEFQYLPDVVCPSELPPVLGALRSQQARWARGSVQCLLKHGLRLGRAPVSLLKRLAGLLHLSAYLVQPLLLGIILLMLPVMLLQAQTLNVLGWLWLFSLVQPALFLISQRELYPDWRRRVAYVPLLLLTSIGLAPAVSQSILAAFTGRPGEFVRTPKFGEAARQYRAPAPALTVALEAGFLTYCLITLGVAVYLGLWGALPWLILFAAGFAMTTFLDLRDSFSPVNG